MKRFALTSIALLMFIALSCKTTVAEKPAAADTPAKAEAPAAKKWHEGITGKYKGVVGGNNDAIIIIFTHKDGELTATYTIDDAEFDDKPYAGKLMKFTETKGKDLTLTCRYEDAMNKGGYEMTFSKDLKKLTGTYAIDGEGETDGNVVTATKE